MDIKKVSYGIVGLSMLAGTIASCSDTKYEDKAKAQAVKYLDGYELLKAERFAHQQYNSDSNSGKAVTYWDSLLIDEKSKRAYLEGQQLIRDSLKGIHHRKTKFITPLDTIIKNNIIESSRNEYAKLVSAEDFIKARKNAPRDDASKFGYNEYTGSTHYWNLITLAGKQNEAYQKGLADARKELKDK